MNDPKSHPAAHSGAAAVPASGRSSEIPLGPAATHDMKDVHPEKHPAHGCSPKIAGEVKPSAGE